MANPNKIKGSDIDWSASTSWAADKYLLGDGTFGTPGTLSSVTVTNTVFVSKGGNDGTGVAERLDLPFLTLAAARTAAIALTPSATKRIRIVVFSGTYLEQLVLANYVDWDLTNAVIDLQDGALYTIDDNNVQCDSIIYGNAQILRSTAGTLGCIRTQNASTNLKISGYSAVSSLAIQPAVDISGGTVEINIPITSAYFGIISSNASVVTVNKNVTTTNARAINASGTSVTTVNNAILTATGSIVVQIGNTSTVKLNSCRLVSSGATGISATNGAVTIVLKDSTIVSTTNSIIITGGGNVLCYGKSQANKPIDSLTTTSIGDLIINASVI